MDGELSPRPGAGARGVVGVAFSSDGTRLAWTSQDGTVLVHDAATGGERLRVAEGAGTFPAVFSADGALLLTMSREGEARVLDTVSGPTPATN